MAKRLTEKQKGEIIRLFNSGMSINDLLIQFNCTRLTISRHLKKDLGEERYKKLILKNKVANNLFDNKKQKIDNLEKIDTDNSEKQKNITEVIDEKSHSSEEFIEIVPLSCDVETAVQKDLTSVSIKEVNFPKIVFMIVDKKVELDIKNLEDYPKWQFLSKDELKRKTIEIYSDIKIAKSFCGKEQKVIKVPNTDVFRIAAPILLSRGISRIVSSDELIAL